MLNNVFVSCVCFVNFVHVCVCVALSVGETADKVWLGRDAHLAQKLCDTVYFL